MTSAFSINFQLVCIDVDGTLINDQKQITPFTYQEIRRISQFAHILLVSSRMPRSLSVLMEELEFAGPAIAYNGGLVLGNHQFSSSEEVLFSHHMTSSTADRLMDLALPYRDRILCGVYSDNDWIINDLNFWGQKEQRTTRVTPEVISEAAIFAEFYHDRPVHKVIFRGKPQDMDALQTQINDLPDPAFQWFRNNPTLIEIVPPQVSKAQGIQRIQDHLGIANAATLAFGDNVNDREMLEYAGHGVAMANAPHSIQQIANEITASNNEDGVGQVLQKYFPR